MPVRPIVDGLFTLEGEQAPRLIVSKCRACGALFFPPRKRCAGCSSPDQDRAEAPGEGTVYSWTTIRELGGYRPEFQPYTIAQVELAPGLVVQGMVDAELGTVAIGQKVRTGLLHPPGSDMGPDVVTYCFLPVEGGTR